MPIALWFSSWDAGMSSLARPQPRWCDIAPLQTICPSTTVLISVGHLSLYHSPAGQVCTGSQSYLTHRLEVTAVCSGPMNSRCSLWPLRLEMRSTSTAPGQAASCQAGSSRAGLRRILCSWRGGRPANKGEDGSGENS